MSLEEQCASALTRAPDLAAIEYHGRWIGWGELRETADAVNSLIDGAGLDQGDPVGFIPRNTPAAAAAMLGMIARGRTLCMIYAFQSAAGIARDIERLKLRAVVAADHDFSEEVLAVVRRQKLAAVALDRVGAHTVAGAGRTLTARDPDAPSEPTLRILTSGTTGPPKHFSIRYAMIDQHIVGANLAFGSAGEVGARAPPALLYFPFGNISGVYSLLPPLINGHPTVLLDKFNLREWHEYVLRYRPRRGSLPPAGVRMVLDADLPVEDLSSIEMMGTGAAPLDPTVQRAFEDKYGIPILMSYGATEFGGPVAAMTAELIPEWGAAKFGSVGRPFAGANLRVLNAETGEELPPGEEGLIEVIAPRIGREWIRTTDIGLIDEDGFLFLRGRSDGAIMRGGFKLLPETIERALMTHPSVAAAAVVGVVDDRLGQVPAAAVQLKPDAAKPSIDALESHLRDRVYATHLPTRYLFVDSLPRTPSMKVDQPAVRALFVDEPATA